MPYSTQRLGTQVLHLASLVVENNMTSRWAWTLNLFSSYGKDAMRLLAPFNYLSSGGIPEVDSSFAAFQGGNGDILRGTASTGLVWKVRENKSISFTAGHSYFDFKGFQGRASLGAPVTLRPTHASSGDIAYEQRISARTTFRAYGQAAHYFYRPCTSYGGGIGFSTMLSRNTSLDLSGGPQFSEACAGQGGNFRANITSRLRPTVSVYATANRQFRANYIEGSVWEDNATVGFGKRGRLVIFLTDAGYMRSRLTTSDVPYQGYFASGSVGFNLSPSVSLVATYRHYYSWAGPPIFRANIAMLSLRWNPLLAGL